MERQCLATEMNSTRSEMKRRISALGVGDHRRQTGVLGDLLADQGQRDIRHAGEGFEALRLVAAVGRPDDAVHLVGREVRRGDVDDDLVDDLAFVRRPQPSGRSIGIGGDVPFLGSLGAPVDILDAHVTALMQLQQEHATDPSAQSRIGLQIPLEMAPGLFGVVLPCTLLVHTAAILFRIGIGIDGNTFAGT